MSDTSVSLLERLHATSDAADWQRLVDLYTPLIRGWLSRHLAPNSDVDDLVQDVLAVVVRKLPDFRHNQRTGAFRAWLRSITVNCLRDHWRARRAAAGAGDERLAALLDQLEDPHNSLSHQWDLEHDQHVARRLMELVEPEFTPQTWRAFQQVAIQGRSPDAVAADLGISVNAVFIAKSRVLSRLRQEGAGLIDE
jgi:RNA polymerase sigma-70 factor (ECF subfamily)